jgi:hypothetical protein
MPFKIPPHNFNILCTCNNCNRIEVEVCCNVNKKFSDVCECVGCCKYRMKYNINHNFFLQCECNRCSKMKQDHINAYRHTCCLILNPPLPDCVCYGCNEFRKDPNKICMPYGECMHSLESVRMNQNFVNLYNVPSILDCNICSKKQ